MADDLIVFLNARLDEHVCDRCREEITRSEIAADPYYQGGAVFGDGA